MRGMWRVRFTARSFAFPRRDLARVAASTCPPEHRGRRESRVPAAPAASRAKWIKAHEHSHYRFSQINPAFPAQWFDGLLRALLGERILVCHRRRRIKASANLAPATGVRTTRLGRT